MSLQIMSLLSILLFAVAIAQSVSPTDIIPQPNVVPDIPGGMTKVDEFCFSAGLLSGCAACNYGTFGLCRYVLNGNSPLESFCVSIQSADAFVQVNTDHVDDLSSCPESYADERFLPVKGSGAHANNIKEARSQAHSIGYCDFPEQPWVVDRTSYLQLQQTVNQSPTDVCQSVNSPLLQQLGRGALPGCTLENEYDEACLSLWMSMLCTSRCPKYGHATSGFCKEDYGALESACSEATIVGRCVPPAELVADAFVDEAEGDIRLCSSAFEIPPTTRFESDFGYYKPCVPTDCQVVSHDESECTFSEPCGVDGTKEVDISVHYGGCGGKSCLQAISETYDLDEDDATCDFDGCRYTGICPFEQDCSIGSASISIDIEAVMEEDYDGLVVLVDGTPLQNTAGTALYSDTCGPGPSELMINTTPRTTLIYNIEGYTGEQTISLQALEDCCCSDDGINGANIYSVVVRNNLGVVIDNVSWSLSDDAGRWTKYPGFGTGEEDDTEFEFRFQEAPSFVERLNAVVDLGPEPELE